MTSATVEWVSDVEGVTVCSDCWDEEMRAKWPRVEAGEGMYCESCSRFVGEMPDWMTINALREALVQIMRVGGSGMPAVSRASQMLTIATNAWSGSRVESDD